MAYNWSKAIAACRNLAIFWFLWSLWQKFKMITNFQTSVSLHSHFYSLCVFVIFQGFFLLFFYLFFCHLFNFFFFKAKFWWGRKILRGTENRDIRTDKLTKSQFSVPLRIFRPPWNARFGLACVRARSEHFQTLRATLEWVHLHFLFWWASSQMTPSMINEPCTHVLG